MVSGHSRENSLFDRDHDDRHDVGEIQRNRRYTNDGIESRSAADVDQAKEHAAQRRCSDGIDRNSSC